VRRSRRPHDRADPRAIEHDVASLLRVLCPCPQALELATDQHLDYPRAIRRVAHLAITHRAVSSRAARTPRNPLFEVNLLDSLIRHSSANHKRESLAFSKRRQSSLERLWIFLVWRNWMKSFSERRRDASPAMRLGLAEGRLSVEEVLARRRFPTHLALPAPWRRHYWREVVTRRIPNGRAHRARYAQ
jgi:hypothetical protein